MIVIITFRLRVGVNSAVVSNTTGVLISLASGTKSAPPVGTYINSDDSSLSRMALNSNSKSPTVVAMKELSSLVSGIVVPESSPQSSGMLVWVYGLHLCGLSGQDSTMNGSHNY